MTLAEARARLGLPPSGALERAEARRAYLQAIKRCKPEVDPEGFQQIRQAYELIEALLQFEAAGPERPPIAAPVEVPVHPPEVTRPDEPPVDHLRPYRDRLQGLFGQPWPIRAQVGWDAYRAFPGDRAARELLLELLPPEARHDITQVLGEGAAAGDHDCLLRLLAFNPAALPAEALDRLEHDGQPGERLLVAQALAARGERALALLDRLLSEGAQLPDVRLVDGALRVGLLFEGRRDGASARQAWTRLRQYLGGAALPAGAPHQLAALYAVASGLETADYLPVELRAELARGALDWRWPGLIGMLQVVARDHGEESLARKLNRLRLESPVLSSVIEQHRRVVVRSKEWSPWSIVRIVAVVTVVGLGRLGSHSCEEPSPTPSVHFSYDGQRMTKILELASEATTLCRDSQQKEMCKVLPVFLDGLTVTQSCQGWQTQLEAIATMAVTPAEKSYFARLRAELPGLCQP